MTIPTRIKRWLQTDDGSKYMLVQKATMRAILWLRDSLRMPAVEPGIEHIAQQATRDALQDELDELYRVLGGKSPRATPQNAPGHETDELGDTSADA